jgi:DNA-binding CsgD family transcriptional regulator
MTPPKECNEAELEGLRRAITWRGIYDKEALEAPGKLDSIRALAERGEQARVLVGVPLKLVIVDRRVGLIPLNVTEGSEEAVVIHDSPLLDALTVLFEVLWERAVPIRFVRGGGSGFDGDASTPSKVDEQVLALLAAGFKDQAIAQHAGVGLSTVERRVRRLMEKLGTQTRFQAGLEAERRGLLRPGSDGDRTAI